MTTSRIQGVAQIARFNWPFYVTAASSIAGACAFAGALPRATQPLLIAGILLAMFWLAASLVVSHVVYDRSKLRTWKWIAPALGFTPRRWVNIHASLDESTPALRRLFGSAGRVFDIFDAQEMTESSIVRARHLAHNSVAPETADYRHLPLMSASIDAAMLLLSAHELRHSESRIVFLRELKRALAPDGKIVLVEHLRDLANFIAFGPGFAHFHSRAAWLADIKAAGLEVESEFRITPFVAVFILRRFS